MPPSLSRRDFTAATALTSASFAVGLSTRARAHSTPHNSSPRLKVGLIGCGGRGTGALSDMLKASPDVELHAMGDVFKDRLDGSRGSLTTLEGGLADRAAVPDDRCFTGFDAYQHVLASGIDIAILATPPGFRAQHFAAAIDAGKHVFMEKPVAVDPAGVRTVIAAAAKAKEQNLSVVAGTQRRHEVAYNEAYQRIQEGAIGPVHSAAVHWNQGGLWMNKRRPEWSDMEWQLRNWLYFAWLSGDHITEQHVHNLDIAHWYMGGPPKRVIAMGGRQVRTSPDYGHVFDHFACEFEYEGGRRVTSYCRQIDGCASRVEEFIHGADGYARLAQFGTAEIYGKNPWKWKGQQTNPYEQEHKDLLASITGSGPYLNHGERIAHSTLMAIMGRMSAYSGKALSWTDALTSPLNLLPSTLALGPLPTPDVAGPGKTPLA
ncbi:MAG TPA: Gfo/Idh/MocA family oxidoreductase [Phycisphaerales bacterium]|nr:Gfo/Idh/MocA family oxidoreductase [Phycisphaerales bacterium]